MLFKQDLVLLVGTQFHGNTLSWEVSSVGFQRAKLKWEPFVSRLHCSRSWRGFYGASLAASSCYFFQINTVPVELMGVQAARGLSPALSPCSGSPAGAENKICQSCL